MLKKFYENKKNVRKVAALEKTEVIKTGGSPPSNIKKDSNHDLILGLMNVKTVYGLDNEFDFHNQIIAEPEGPAENEKEFVYEFGSNEYWTIEKDDNMVQIQTSQTVQTPTSITHTNEIQIPSSSQTLTPTSIAHHPNKQNYSNLFLGANSQMFINITNTYNTTSQQNKNSQFFTGRANYDYNVRIFLYKFSVLLGQYQHLLTKRLRIAEKTENEFKEKTAEHLKRMELRFRNSNKEKTIEFKLVKIN
ncbi:unnamed protein product [Psylliodes chrysocephalus]|uniref:Uncharacterized protein n=1 Tax=Psylliodes chrysocephalus TaxID=3402493 RepID=A0A9P0CZ72_9CUCU|nr:unnamed protein product [Psylliodes chrysocephala]